MGKWIPDAEPDWWDDLTDIMGNIQDLGVMDWFRQKIVRFMIGAVAGFVLSIAGIIRGAWNTIEDAIAAAGSTIFGTMGETLAPMLAPIANLNNAFVDMVAVGALGPFEGPAVAMIYIVELAVAVRLLKPWLLSMADSFGAIPVVGSVLSAGLTMSVEASDNLFSGARRAFGGFT